MTRLVIGELGHAMPVAHSMDMGAPGHEMSAAMSSDAATSIACSEHEGSEQQTPSSHHGDADGDAADVSSGEHDCCKSGECECPCLHAPCAALDALVVNAIVTTLLRIPHGAEGVISQRPSGLFRPPA